MVSFVGSIYVQIDAVPSISQVEPAFTLLVGFASSLVLHANHDIGRLWVVFLRLGSAIPRIALAGCRASCTLRLCSIMPALVHVCQKEVGQVRTLYPWTNYRSGHLACPSYSWCVESLDICPSPRTSLCS